MALAPLADDVSRYSRDTGLSGQLTLLERAWEAEMGGWAAMAKLVALDRFSLVVEVANSAAMQELSLRRREIVRRLNRHFSNPFLQHMTIKLSHGD